MGRYRCEELEPEVARAFIDENHRQGAIQATGKALGLFLRGDLIGVIHVGPPRTAAMRRRYSLELYRLAFKRGVRAPGGASKLIKSYIETYRISDLFTYQDTTGENTQVYAHSGMTLVVDGLTRRKNYLVAPGKTLATASRKEALGMAYAVRYGPDRILGTKLGEVFDQNGKRKTNKNLFIDHLGWHEEVTTGDSLWEWVRPERTYYTYRVTAKDSAKYYYGVSHVKKAHATLEDCLNDGYYGSGAAGGGGKFGNWKKRHISSLQKEVLGLYTYKAEAYMNEHLLVGEAYKNDPLCLNSTSGGKLQPQIAGRLREGLCAIHGKSTHNGDTCLRCVSARAHKIEKCSIHGYTSFFGNKCEKCVAATRRVLKECPTHGLTTHQGKQCYRCLPKGVMAPCAIHGSTLHFGGTCMRCRNESSVNVKDCPTHGTVKHLGDRCYLCTSGGAVAIKLCSVHGETKHRGDKCFKCRKRNTIVTEKHCSVHGSTKHQGETCVKCSRKPVEFKSCSIHGYVKHRGDACFTCAAAKRVRKTS
jgi:hypothetical protein